MKAIDCCHKYDVVHRDIKPENFIFSTKGPNKEIKLADFGLSRRFGHLTMNTLAGTPYYMAPEVIKGNYSFECDA